MTSPAIEKVLGDIHALLGETPEAVAAVEELRGMSEDFPALLHTYGRLLLALKKADHNCYMRGYNDAVSDYEENDGPTSCIGEEEP